MNRADVTSSIRLRSGRDSQFHDQTMIHDFAIQRDGTFRNEEILPGDDPLAFQAFDVPDPG